jgi:hypothetical protein
MPLDGNGQEDPGEETIEDLHHRIDDEDLDIDETCIMVLKN